MRGRKNLRFVVCFFLIFFSFEVYAQDKSTKVKFYNFDDLLIDGKVKKPQLLFVDTRQKVKFERLLKLKKDLIPKLKATSKDPVLK
tara:strand:+ start:301 stop:558 length:258 start_codon:yes stop_codon:yes gene_type:complete